jgi:hypothetical protein
MKVVYAVRKNSTTEKRRQDKLCFSCFDENITETKVANSKNVLGSILGEHGLRDNNLSCDIKKKGIQLSGPW